MMARTQFNATIMNRTESVNRMGAMIAGCALRPRFLWLCPGLSTADAWHKRSRPKLILNFSVGLCCAAHLHFMERTKCQQQTREQCQLTQKNYRLVSLVSSDVCPDRLTLSRCQCNLDFALRVETRCESNGKTFDASFEQKYKLRDGNPRVRRAPKKKTTHTRMGMEIKLEKKELQ